jgi:hypothetical protein
MVATEWKNDAILGPPCFPGIREEIHGQAKSRYECVRWED